MWKLSDLLTVNRSRITIQIKSVVNTAMLIFSNFSVKFIMFISNSVRNKVTYLKIKILSVKKSE